MIEQAITKLGEMHDQATRLKKLDILDPRAAYFDQRGTVLKQELPIPARNHTVETIESFALAVKEYEDGAAIWVTLSQAIAVLKDAPTSHRCDRVTLPVEPSPFFDVLETQSWCTQEQLVDTLRHGLAGAEIDPDSTLAAVRNLKFATNSEATGNFTNTSAKLGKQVESKVSGEVELPEFVTVEFHPYPQLEDEIEVSVIVTCTLFSNPAKQVLKLAPQPGQLDAARTKATLALRSTIAAQTGEEIQVFVGTP